MHNRIFTEDDILCALTRKPIPPGQITLYKALYEAKGQVLSSEELAERIRWGDRISLRGVLGALGNRINQIERFSAQKPGFTLLIAREEGSGGYCLRPEVREVIDRLPELRQAMSRSVEEIHNRYASEESWLQLCPGHQPSDARMQSSTGSECSGVPPVPLPALSEGRRSSERGAFKPLLPLSVLTWNIQDFFRPASSPDALDALAALPSLPEVLTLQEVKLAHAATVCDHLQKLGYKKPVYSCRPDDAGKRYGNVIAARMDLTPVDPTPFAFPWPQLVAHARVKTLGGPVNVVTVHIPNGDDNGWKKIQTLDALKQMVLGLKGEPLILTGDFNEPQYAMQDGQVVTFGQEQSRGRWVVYEGEWTDKNGVTDELGRWDPTVRWFFENPLESGLRNTFWDVAGHGTMEPSHLSRGLDRWFDHIFVSEHFTVCSCEFLHSWREKGYSDHSPLRASLSYAPG